MSAGTDAGAAADHREIVRALDRYAEALDGRDWTLLARVFTPNVVFDWQLWQAESLEAAVASIRQFLDGCGPTQHLLGNYRVEFDGDRAHSACYVRAFHIGVGSRAGLHYEMGGEYRDEWRRTAEGWRSEKRLARVIFEHGDRSVLGPAEDGVAPR